MSKKWLHYPYINITDWSNRLYWTLFNQSLNRSQWVTKSNRDGRLLTKKNAFTEMSNSIRVNLEEYLYRYLASNCANVERTINAFIKAFDEKMIYSCIFFENIRLKDNEYLDFRKKYKVLGHFKTNATSSCEWKNVLSTFMSFLQEKSSVLKFLLFLYFIICYFLYIFSKSKEKSVLPKAWVTTFLHSHDKML